MQPVEKLSVTLPGELAEKVRAKVASGEYASQSDVTRAALRLWEECEKLKERKLAWRQVKEAMDTVRYIGREPEPSEEEVMRMVVEELKASRRARREGRS